MITDWKAAGGLQTGGQGTFAFKGGHRCLLEVTAGGLRTMLGKLTTYFQGWYYIGLYQNDWTPSLGSTLGEVVPADFPGYSGLKQLGAWTKAATVGVRAKSTSKPVTWRCTANGHPNTIHGYYVVDDAGGLAWAERFCSGSIVVDKKGRSITVIPAFSTKNEKEEDS